MRAIRSPGIILLTCAFVLAIVSSVSLPAIKTLDVTYTDFESPVTIANNTITRLQFGIWTNCYHLVVNGSTSCANIGYAYSVPVFNVASNETITIQSSLTRGLVVHPIAALAIVGALFLSPFPSAVFVLGAGILSLISILACLLAFILDIILYAQSKHKFSAIEGSKTFIGIGAWISLATTIVVGVASISLFLARKDMMRPSSSPENNGGAVNITVNMAGNK